MPLRRTLPFLAYSTKAGSDKRVFLLDNFELSDEVISKVEFRKKLSLSLKVGNQNTLLTSDEAIEIVEKQYQACLEFIYSHPFWADLRDTTENGKKSILSYLLETRHYLDAASFRMARGIKYLIRSHKLTSLIVEHVIEEENHNLFFENALNAFGCTEDLVSKSRPLPVSVEWIYLMRALANQDPLCAVLSSGLLEYTAQDRKVVKEWHDMLSEKSILPVKAKEAIFKHVQVDIQMGHGSNWKEALNLEKYISSGQLVIGLNAIGAVAEMLSRWLDTIKACSNACIVNIIPSLIINGQKKTISPYVNGNPIWPAEIMHHMTYGCCFKEPAQQVMAIAYSFSGEASSIDNPYIASLCTEAKKFKCNIIKNIEFNSFNSIEALMFTIEQWMVAIEGHHLWKQMIEEPTYSLVCGWLLENYHYISAISEHTGRAISTCTDPVIRSLLVHHLKEEINHGEILAETLRKTKYGNVIQFRPLPTTISFIGALCELAEMDWRAYCIALSYLQLTLSTKDSQDRHHEFYSAVLSRLPEAELFIDAMKSHDNIDSKLGHAADIKEILESLSTRHSITLENLDLASIIPQLTWSFLDGIRSFYSFGDRAVITREGWRID